MKHIIFDCDGTLLNTKETPYFVYPGIKELILDLTGEFSLYVWTARGRGSLRRALEENTLALELGAVRGSESRGARPD